MASTRKAWSFLSGRRSRIKLFEGKIDRARSFVRRTSVPSGWACIAKIEEATRQVCPGAVEFVGVCAIESGPSGVPPGQASRLLLQRTTSGSHQRVEGDPVTAKRLLRGQDHAPHVFHGDPLAHRGECRGLVWTARPARIRPRASRTLLRTVGDSIICNSRYFETGEPCARAQWRNGGLGPAGQSYCLGLATGGVGTCALLYGTAGDPCELDRANTCDARTSCELVDGEAECVR